MNRGMGTAVPSREGKVKTKPLEVSLKQFVVLAALLISVSSLAQQGPGRGPGPSNGPGRHDDNRPLPPPPPPAPGPVGQCSSDELRREADRSEQNTLDRVRRDMSVEGRAVVSVRSSDERRCVEEGIRMAQSRRNDAINDCVRQTTYFRNCETQGTRVVQQPTRISAVTGNGHIDDKNTNEAQCRINAQNAAINQALSSCQATYGQACQIVSGPTAATHRIEQRRLYIIAGPKDDYHICDSQAQALPATSDQVACSVEIFAKVRF